MRLVHKRLDVANLGLVLVCLVSYSWVVLDNRHVLLVRMRTLKLRSLLLDNYGLCFLCWCSVHNWSIMITSSEVGCVAAVVDSVAILSLRDHAISLDEVDSSLHRLSIVCMVVAAGLGSLMAIWFQFKWSSLVLALKFMDEEFSLCSNSPFISSFITIIKCHRRLRRRSKWLD